MPATEEMASAQTTALASELRLAVTRLSRRLRRERPATSLTPSQMSALTTLDSRGPLSPSALADCERIQPPSMTRIIAGMEAKNLISRVPHATDRRQFVLELTPEGRATVNEDRLRREAWLAKQLATLSNEDRAAVAAVLPIIERLARS